MQGEYKAMKMRTDMFGDGEWHLYNEVADPSEMRPLVTEMPEKFESMEAFSSFIMSKKGSLNG